MELEQKDERSQSRGVGESCECGLRRGESGGPHPARVIPPRGISSGVVDFVPVVTRFVCICNVTPHLETGVSPPRGKGCSVSGR